MTRQQFHSWVADPSLLDRRTLEDLQNLVERYPYFQAAHLLLAKNLKGEQHIDQRRQLHLAAIYASDRNLLFRLMEGTHQVKRSEDERPHFEERTRTVVETEKVEIEEADRDVVQLEVREERNVVLPLNSEDVPDFADLPSKDVAAGDEIKAIASDEEVRSVEEVVQDVVVTEVAHTSLYDLIPEPLIYRIEDADLPEPLKRYVAPEALTFGQWLMWVQQHEEPVQAASPALPQLAKSKDNMSLIEEFLSSQPERGKSQRAEFFKPSKAAEDSNRHEFSVISETLANIYEQQGKYALAVKAFDALALKYPKKSSYFAARKMVALEKQGGLSG